MAEQQAIQLHITENIHRIEVIGDFLSTNSDANDKECRNNIDILTKINKALEEVQKYREIGTPDKIKEELDRLRNDNECQGLYFTLEERQDLARQHRELEEYKAIGTPEECMAAVEKQKAKKPIIEYEQTHDCVTEIEWKCPTCGTNYIELAPCGEWCRYCGTKLDWSEEQ